MAHISYSQYNLAWYMLWEHTQGMPCTQCEVLDVC